VLLFRLFTEYQLKACPRPPRGFSTGENSAVKRQSAAGQKTPSRSASQSGSKAFHLVGNDPVAMESGKRLRDVLVKGVSRLRKPGSFTQVKAGGEKAVAGQQTHFAPAGGGSKRGSASFQGGVLTGAAPQILESGLRKKAERMRPPPSSAIAKTKSNTAGQVSNFLGACTPRSRPLTESLALDNLHNVQGAEDSLIPTPQRQPSEKGNVRGFLKFLSTPVSSMKKSRSAMTGKATQEVSSDDEGC